MILLSGKRGCTNDGVATGAMTGSSRPSSREPSELTTAGVAHADEVPAVASQLARCAGTPAPPQATKQYSNAPSARKAPAAPSPPAAGPLTHSPLTRSAPVPLSFHPAATAPATVGCGKVAP